MSQPPLQNVRMSDNWRFTPKRCCLGCFSHSPRTVLQPFVGRTVGDLGCCKRCQTCQTSNVVQASNQPLSQQQQAQGTVSLRAKSRAESMGRAADALLCSRATRPCESLVIMPGLRFQTCLIDTRRQT